MSDVSESVDLGAWMHVSLKFLEKLYLVQIAELKAMNKGNPWAYILNVSPSITGLKKTWGSVDVSNSA